LLHRQKPLAHKLQDYHGKRRNKLNQNIHYRGRFNDYIGLEESAEIVTKEQDPIGSQTKVLAVTRKRIISV